MSAQQPRYSAEETAQRGNEMYERTIRAQVETTHYGKVVAIDIETGAYAIDDNALTAARCLRAQHPDAEIAPYRASRIPSSPDTMAKALEGDDRPEHVCTRTPSLALYDWTHQHIAACDQDMERVLSTLDALVDRDAHPFPPPTPTHRQPQRNEPAFALRSPLSRITGVDRTHVPGLQALTIHIILAEVGLKRHTWLTDKHCASWLGLCPDHQISGGTVLSTGSRRVHNRASRALRMAAHSLRTSPTSLGAFFRRMRSTLGPAKATTATAHTRAKMLSPMLKEQTPYRARGVEEYLHKDHEPQLRQVRKQAKLLGCDVVPQPNNAYARRRRDHGEA